jgi:tetratricopeptide (TPR) repeat protein
MRVSLLACWLTLIPAAGGAQSIVAPEQAGEAVRHYRAGQEALAAEQFERAIAEFTEATRLDPLLALAYYGLGQTHMARRAYPEAVLAFTACRDAYARIAGLSMSNSTAMTQRIDDEIRELRDTMRRMTATQGSGGEPPLKATAIESQIRELEKMKNAGAEAIRPPAAVSLALGSAYFHQERLVDAERSYREAVSLDPRLGEAHNNLAVVLLLTDRTDEARREAKLAQKCGFRVNPQFLEDLKHANE